MAGPLWELHPKSFALGVNEVRGYAAQMSDCIAAASRHSHRGPAANGPKRLRAFKRLREESVCRLAIGSKSFFSEGALRGTGLAALWADVAVGREMQSVYCAAKPRTNIRQPRHRRGAAIRPQGGQAHLSQGRGAAV